MKALGLLVFAFISTTSLADKQEFQEKFLTATGGRVTLPGSQNGSVVIANAQKDANPEWLNESAKYISEALHYNVVVEDCSFDMPNAKRPGAVVIYVVNDNKMPTVLCAAEDFWGVVNVSKLKTEKMPFYKARVMKEISRVFAMVCGAHSSRYVGTLLQPISSVQDLDSHVDNRLPADIIARIPPYLKEIGITPATIMTYVAACKQGWALPPTNEYQKAIWEKVKAEMNEKPSNPIKVTFDPNKSK